jgi:hypothetical protein
MSHETLTHQKESLEQISEEYRDDAERPLGGYLILMGAFMALFGGFLALARITGRWLPEQFRTSDILLFGTATQHLGRIISKAGVTSPLRAPFTRYQGTSGPPAELQESVRERGVRHAIGELLTCPFCTGLWVAAFFAYGLVLMPRVTRLIATIFTIDAISDVLNLLYDTAANLATKTPDLLERKISGASDSQG